MVARATAPNRIGPGSVFPNVGTWDFSSGLKGVWRSVIFVDKADVGGDFREPNGICTFLDCPDLSARYCLGILLVLPKRTTW